MLVLPALLAEHHDSLVVCLASEHLLDLCVLDGFDEVLVVQLDFLLQRDQYLLDLCEESLEGGLALTAALLASLLQVELLKLAVDYARLYLEEL